MEEQIRLTTQHQVDPADSRPCEVELADALYRGGSAPDEGPLPAFRSS